MSPSTGGSRTAAVEAHGPRGLRMRLGSGPDAAAEARRALSELRADLDPPLMETLRLLVTELVTNSVRHTDCDSVTLRVAIGKAAVLTEVADDGPGFDADAALEAEQRDARGPDTGWGLFLVQRLARDWGVKQEKRSKRVWFELGRA
ncbi:MAG TPA: ATP-binding protein [Thermoleophilaceae bacterium]|nr:ATP-binding protein [Thermoleophilaceae bacterium]